MSASGQLSGRLWAASRDRRHAVPVASPYRLGRTPDPSPGEGAAHRGSDPRVHRSLGHAPLRHARELSHKLFARAGCSRLMSSAQKTGSPVSSVGATSSDPSVSRVRSRVWRDDAKFWRYGGTVGMPFLSWKSACAFAYAHVYPGAVSLAGTAQVGAPLVPSGHNDVSQQLLRDHLVLE